MLTIREATTNDAEGKGYVHYQSWNETYTGLVNQDYLNHRSLDKCIDLAKKHPENCFVAELDGIIVGFSCYVIYKDENGIEIGEIRAIYILKAYQKMGIGKNLMNACLAKLSKHKKVYVWVLDTNHQAIHFYTYMGFKEDGTKKIEEVYKDVFLNEIRLVLEMNNR